MGSSLCFQFRPKHKHWGCFLQPSALMQLQPTNLLHSSTYEAYAKVFTWRARQRCYVKLHTFVEAIAGAAHI